MYAPIAYVSVLSRLQYFKVYFIAEVEVVTHA